MTVDAAEASGNAPQPRKQGIMACAEGNGSDSDTLPSAAAGIEMQLSGVSEAAAAGKPPLPHHSVVKGWGGPVPPVGFQERLQCSRRSEGSASKMQQGRSSTRRSRAPLDSGRRRRVPSERLQSAFEQLLALIEGEWAAIKDNNLGVKSGTAVVDEVLLRKLRRLVGQLHAACLADPSEGAAQFQRRCSQLPRPQQQQLSAVLDAVGNNLLADFVQLTLHCSLRQLPLHASGRGRPSTCSAASPPAEHETAAGNRDLRSLPSGRPGAGSLQLRPATVDTGSLDRGRSRINLYATHPLVLRARTLRQEYMMPAVLPPDSFSSARLGDASPSNARLPSSEKLRLLMRKRRFGSASEGSLFQLDWEEQQRAMEEMHRVSATWGRVASAFPRAALEKMLDSDFFLKSQLKGRLAPTAKQLAAECAAAAGHASNKACAGRPARPRKPRPLGHATPRAAAGPPGKGTAQQDGSTSCVAPESSSTSAPDGEEKAAELCSSSMRSSFCSMDGPMSSPEPSHDCSAVHGEAGSEASGTSQRMEDENATSWQPGEAPQASDAGQKPRAAVRFQGNEAASESRLRIRAPDADCLETDTRPEPEHSCGLASGSSMLLDGAQDQEKPYVRVIDAYRGRVKDIQDLHSDDAFVHLDQLARYRREQRAMKLQDEQAAAEAALAAEREALRATKTMEAKRAAVTRRWHVMNDAAQEKPEESSSESPVMRTRTLNILKALAMEHDELSLVTGANKRAQLVKEHVEEQHAGLMHAPSGMQTLEPLLRATSGQSQGVPFKINIGVTQIKGKDISCKRPEWVPEERWERYSTGMRQLLAQEEPEFSGSFVGSSAFSRNTIKGLEGVLNANPVAFHSPAAEEAETEYRSAAQRAKASLERALDAQMEESSVHDFLTTLNGLRAKRAFFAGPCIKPDRYQQAEFSKTERPAEPPWDIDASIFARRKQENEPRWYYDTEKLYKRQFDMDWSRVVAKKRFCKLIARSDAVIRADPSLLQAELHQIQEVLRSKAPLIRSSFVYYSMHHSKYTGTAEISLLEFHAFADRCRLSCQNSKYCQKKHLDSIFVSTNYEEESGTQEADDNDDDALVRFEFVELLVRLAVARYVEEGVMDCVSAAVQRLFDEQLVPNLPPEALIDCNEFREFRLYNKPMELLVIEHFKFLEGAYRVHKARDKQKYMWVSHFEQCLENAGLLSNPAVALTRPAVRFMYLQSQIQVSDELKRRSRATSITLFDFIEALARVADFLDFPSEEEIDDYFALTEPPKTTAKVWEFYQQKVLEVPRVVVPVKGLVGEPKNLPEYNFRALLEMMVMGLRTAWGGKTMCDCAAIMAKTATTLSGGIEICR